MRRNILILFLFLVACDYAQIAIAQTLNFSRPTITAVALKDAPFYHQKIYEDDEYLFAYRRYGRAEYAPGFFVYGKKQKKWSEIKKVTTEHAKLGSYNTSDAFVWEVVPNSGNLPMRKILSQKPNIPVLAISWDFTSLKNVEYAAVPLDAYGSVGFPDKITYDKDGKVYRLSFGSVYNIEQMLTEFWIRKADLKKGFSQHF